MSFKCHTFSIHKIHLKFKMSHMTLTMPLSRMVCYPWGRT